MFNIHLIREPWRDIPTAKALQRLADEIEKSEGRAADETELRDLTGLSLDRVRQLMYVMTLPDEWQDHIRNGQIPLNFFWELKKNVIDALKNNRPNLLTEYGESNISEAFVKKRLDQVITDTVSLRKVSPIIKFAGQDAKVNDLDESAFDATIRNLIDQPDSTIEDAYEETVQTLVEVDKLSRRTASMVAAFDRLLSNTTDQEDRDTINRLGRDLIAKLSALLDADE
ncbi:chromosome partitioning protein ParB [Corynebacterium sp. HMSC034A01]|nr:chromosome partitioning protein ParB [Corynebacterium sp. HMSC034A01]